MIFIYDIVLNWCKDNVYDFFEWDSKDKLEHIKRIPLFKVDKDIIKDILYYNIQIDEEFNRKTFNMAESYTTSRVNKIPYAYLITDGISIIALKTDKFGNVEYKSKLLLEEEEEILCISSKLKKIDLNYKKNEKIFNNNNFMTRNEIKIKRVLKDELERIYKLKDFDMLKYLYTEYTDKEELDIENIYNFLKSSLEIEINENHFKLYNLLSLISNTN